MAADGTVYPKDVEKQTAYYLQKLAKIDQILRRPVETLIEQALESGRGGIEPPEYRFPAWLSEQADPPKDHGFHSPPTQAVCFAVLQRLWRLRRRFSWLETKKNCESLELVKNRLAKWFFEPARKADFEFFAQKLFQSTVFGNLNPLGASYIFRVLVEAGESQAHSAFGFLAVFAMLWPLYRRFPDRLTAGARIEPWEPTAYVTSNCLLCLATVERITAHRADILRSIGAHMDRLKATLNRRDERGEWLFSLELDELCVDLRRLSGLTAAEEHFSNAADELETKSESLKPGSPSVHEDLRLLATRRIGEGIGKIGGFSDELITAAKKALQEAKAKILEIVGFRSKLGRDGLNSKAPDELLANDIGLLFAKEYLYEPLYWQDLFEAAERAFKVCDALVKVLGRAARSCTAINAESSDDDIKGGIESLVQANERVIKVMRHESPLREAAEWSRTVMERQIAYASAGNLTDFDAGELVSAIAVAVRWELISTSLQVSDAVTKALRGARRDGGWNLGLPFFSRDNAGGIWAGTSELISTLTGAIRTHPDVRVADKMLFRYLNWLERTKVVLKLENREVVGWPSDRLRHYRKIHLVTTAFSINALLEIRDLVEYRLWQVCQKRFAAVSGIEGLHFKDIEPVDLGAKHSHRLHRVLAQMISHSQDTQRSRFASADYSLILHGPPGSSKTRIAEGLAARIWRDSGRSGDRLGRENSPRFIRVTPADFTRMGEDRIDSEARLIFDLLTHVRGVTIFFDEIDDLLRRRSTKPDHQPTFLELVVPAMLNRLADLRAACPRQEICFALATNYIDNIEPALIRPGRIDRPLPVVYPDQHSRAAIVCRYADAASGLGVKENPFTVFQQRIVELTSGWPWMAIDRVLKELRKRVPSALSDDNERKMAKVLEDVVNEFQSIFAPPQYGPRLERDDASPEFCNEVAHYLISREALTKPNAVDLVLKGAAVEGEVRLNIKKTISQKLRAVAEREGREFTRSLFENELNQEPKVHIQVG